MSGSGLDDIVVPNADRASGDRMGAFVYYSDLGHANLAGAKLTSTVDLEDKTDGCVGQDFCKLSQLANLN